MRRVVVTGLGIVSSIGNNAEEVLAALKAGTSGIEASPEMAEHGFRSRVAGTLKIDVAEHIDKRTLRFMGPGAAYAHIAMEQAIADAGLERGPDQQPAHRAGRGVRRAVDLGHVHRASHRATTPARPSGSGPLRCRNACPRPSARTSRTAFKIKGINYSITSACSTSLHCIGNGGGADHAGQAGRDVRRRRRGAGLDAVVPLRRDGRDVAASTTTRPRRRQPRL